MHLRTIYLSVVFLAGLMPLPSIGAGDHMAGQHVAAAQTHRGQGTVREIDAGKARVKIAHGPIASLGWDGMTMFFNVSEPRLLENLKPGDKVAFDIGRDKNGRLVITGMTRIN